MKKPDVKRTSVETTRRPVVVPQTYKMSVGMRLGPPTLRIRNLQQTLSFYQNDIGLRAIGNHPDPQDGLDIVELGFPDSKEPLLALKHHPDAKPTGHDCAGLYHYAILVPDRKSLSSTYLAIGNTGLVYEGFADHTVSESLYLHDNEQNGIEIYADRPRNTWAPFMELMKKGGSSDMRNFVSLNKPLNIDFLLGELSRDERNNPTAFPAGARIGHIHLRVTNLQRSVRFYHEKLGLDIIGNLPDIGAAFFSVGGYHHHIGMNTLHSEDGKPHERGEAGLENFVLNLPDQASIDALAQQLGSSFIARDEDHLTILDPDGIEIIVRAGGDNP